ncbi:hypothetical protein [Falsiroseomonas sp. CW058]|uniref:bestrophin-like domain n=1 Tax=Falsiroseomonas sp. CW058 TaxID=3388664 RepID=UPI003D3141BF
MLDLLYAAPSWAIFLSFSGLAVASALAVPLLARLVRPAPDTKEQLDVALRATGIVSGVLTLVLAFSAAEARVQLQEARATVNREAQALESLLRAGSFALAEPAPLREVAIRYARTAATEEFPAMRRGEASAATAEAMAALETVTRQAAARLGPGQAADLLRQVDDVSDLRDTRLRQSEGGVPAEFWMLVLLLTAALFACGALFPPRRHNLALVGVQAAVMGALLAFVFIMDQPYRGSVSAGAAPLLHAAEVMARR